MFSTQSAPASLSGRRSVQLRVYADRLIAARTAQRPARRIAPLPSLACAVGGRWLVEAEKIAAPAGRIPACRAPRCGTFASRARHRMRIGRAPNRRGGPAAPASGRSPMRRHDIPLCNHSNRMPSDRV
jgi:hypothetical protein